MIAPIIPMHQHEYSESMVSGLVSGYPSPQTPSGRSMIEINGYKFYEEPGSCGSCPCMNTGATHLNPGVKRGHCILWNEWHLRYRNIPARCHKLFKKAMTYPDGSKLSIVAKE